MHSLRNSLISCGLTQLQYNNRLLVSIREIWCLFDTWYLTGKALLSQNLEYFQTGRKPKIHVWDAETMRQLSVMEAGHNQGVCALSFSSSGRKLASVGTDNSHTVTLWDWKAAEEICRGKGHGDKVFCVKFDPDSKHNLAICGVKHVKFLHPKNSKWSGLATVSVCFRLR